MSNTENIDRQVDRKEFLQLFDGSLPVEQITNAWYDKYKNSNYGAIITFVGVVRDENKIDGLSAALEYKNGKFIKGATRGNGLVGEDVTENLKTVKTIPMQLNENIDITVRGEVFISKQDFEKMNQEREENEQE